MPLQALGYVGFGSAALEDWRQFGTRLVGLQAVERGPSLLAFRMDDRKQRIIVDRSMAEDQRFFGWEVEGAEPVGTRAELVAGSRPRDCAKDADARGRRRLARPGASHGGQLRIDVGDLPVVGRGADQGLTHDSFPPPWRVREGVSQKRRRA